MSPRHYRATFEAIKQMAEKIDDAKTRAACVLEFIDQDADAESYISRSCSIHQVLSLTKSATQLDSQLLALEQAVSSVIPTGVALSDGGIFGQGDGGIEASTEQVVSETKAVRMGLYGIEHRPESTKADTESGIADQLHEWLCDRLGVEIAPQVIECRAFVRQLELFKGVCK